MAKVISNRRCVMCGQVNVQMWTIDNLKQACVTYLCGEHGAPLQAILNAAGDLAPNEQVPLPDRDKEPPLEPAEKRRQSNMVPLLGWTPPD